MRSHVFQLTDIELGGRIERMLRGGRHLFPDLPRALRDVRRIGVVGWGPQARAQSMNLRESLAGSGIEVAVGLRPGSPSRDDAVRCGFEPDDVDVVLRSADLALLLVSDAALAEHHRDLFGLVRPGATVGLSHGFLLGHLESMDASMPRHCSIVAMCPKGMGASVRRLYEQGREVDGAGINASIAVHHDLDGWSTDRALAWAVGVGAPFVFETTLEDEYRSDLVGERSILLSVPHAIAESVYRRQRSLGDGEAAAFVKAAESMTGPLARTISSGGVRGVLDALSGDARRQFDDAFCAAYRPMLALIEEAYDDVTCGAELASVRAAAARLDRHPMPEIDGTRMWRVGAAVRAARDDEPAAAIDPLVAGLFVAALMAQVDVLVERGHRWSEIANESVIEVVDSLLPYMHARGIAHMVDSCSTTARLGARRWAPRFDAAIEQQVLPLLDGAGNHDDALLRHLATHPIHDVLTAIAAFRPSVDIAVAVA